MRLETKAIHSGLNLFNDTQAVVPPLTASTVFKLGEDKRSSGQLVYTRAQNPNRAQLEALLADLEGGEECAAFSSGVAASAALFQALGPDDHVILPADVYHGTRALVKELMSPWKLEATFVDMTDVREVKRAIRESTRLIWLESPSNPLLHITDIRKICRVAREQNVTTCVDNTWPSPVNQQPLELGADFSLHSTTKYLGGHSDLLGGAIIAKQKKGIFERIRKIQIMAGAVPSPRDCWLLSRSIRTLPYRVRGHNENALKIARYLNDHPAVEKVYYPGLETDPGHEIAKKQMTGFGGMISFLVDGGKKETEEIVDRSKLVFRATSLGGVESTWEQRRSVEGEESVTPWNLIRISVGLEHPDDLLEDLEQALS